MAIKIPRQITIKGETWRIKRFKNLKDESGVKIYGECDFDNKIIKIEKELDSDMNIFTFLHEFLHASMHELHLTLDRDIEEIIADGVAFILKETFDFKIKKK